MPTINRAAQFAKLQKVLKKHFKGASSNPGRTVLEHLLFACCLEDARYEPAEEAFAALVHTFFDWNEVRVTSISELAEVMACLPDPRQAANRIKRILHAIFEVRFNFDLEELKKKNLGPAVEWLAGLDGASKFTVGYVEQAGLGGHAIPIDSGTLTVLRILDMITDKDVEQKIVPGLERAIPKPKGVEFGSMLHQLSADFSANPYSPAVKAILLEISPDAKDRLPKRRSETAKPAPAPAEPPKEKAKEKQAAAPAPGKGAAKTPDKAEKKPAAAEKKPAVPGKKQEVPEKKPAHTEKKAAPVEKKPEPKKPLDVPTKKKSAPAAEKQLPGKKDKKKSSGESAGARRAPAPASPKKKSHTEKLAKRKPR